MLNSDIYKIIWNFSKNNSKYHLKVHIANVLVLRLNSRAFVNFHKVHKKKLEVSAYLRISKVSSSSCKLYKAWIFTVFEWDNQLPYISINIDRQHIIHDITFSDKDFEA